MILFNLSGEHPKLPFEEVKALYEAFFQGFNVLERSNCLLLVKDDLDARVLSRLALTHEFYAVEKVTDIKNLDRLLLGLDIKKGATFCIRCLGFPDNAAEERRAGEVIFESKKNPVSLTKPKVSIYLAKLDDKITISLKRYETDDFSKRDPNDRPFFHPLALNPKLARLFLNLARLKTGDRVLDPFCGSGSVLIEAALMGLEAGGIDRDRKMLWGCKKNLEFYGLKALLAEGDATDIKVKNVDGIATDPPYARSSKMFARELKELYPNFLKSAFSALKPGGYLVLAVPADAEFVYKKAGFELAGDYLMYVHRSLTRRIYILKKPK